MVLVALAVGNRRLLLLVLHLEHDGEQLVALVVVVAEDEVPLGAAHSLVILLEVGARVGLQADAVKLRLAVLLERLADELGGQAHAVVAQALDVVAVALDELVFGLELALSVVSKLVLALGHLLAQVGLGASAICLLHLELGLQLVAAALEVGRGAQQLCLALGAQGLLLSRELRLEPRDLAREGFLTLVGLVARSLCGLLRLGALLVHLVLKRRTLLGRLGTHLLQRQLAGLLLLPELRLEPGTLLSRSRALPPNGQLLLALSGLELRAEPRQLLARGGPLLLGGQLLPVGGIVELGLQLGDLCLRLGHTSVGLAALLGARRLELGLVQVASLGKALLEVVGKQLVTQLPRKVLDLGRVDLDDLAAVGTLDLCHGNLLGRTGVRASIRPRPDTNHPSIVALSQRAGRRGAPPSSRSCHAEIWRC